MHSFRLLIFLITYSLILSLALADVNIQFGEFKIQHEDTLDKTFSLKRFYSSRSLNKGLFGYGWCSILDTKLKPHDEKSMKLFFCDEALIVDKNRLIFPANKEGFISWEQKGQRFQFNPRGYLTKILIKGTELSLHYDPHTQRILQIKTPDKKISLAIENQLIVSIHNAHQSLFYKYTDHKLSEVHLKTKKNYLYTYDAYANLIRWQHQHYLEKMEYDNEFDVVRFYLQKDQCRNSYGYSHFNKSKFIIQTRHCPHQKPQTIKYSFDYNKKQIKINVLPTMTKMGSKSDEPLSQ